MTTKRKKINYLNNADLLREIHLSKMTFCWVQDKKYADYDIIVSNERDINLETLLQGRENRIKRQKTDVLREIQKKHNCTPKAAQAMVDECVLSAYEKCTVNDVVVRVMTADHIPKNDDDAPIRTNFKPFKHFAMDDDGMLIEVARSHWRGTNSDGAFFMTHGRLTDALGKMFIVLCDRIGMRPNYRGYSFLDEMKADARFQLTKNALLFDESRITVQLNPFAYYTTIVNHAFKAVLNSEKRNRDIRDDLLEESGYDPSNTRIVEYEIAMINAKREQNFPSTSARSMDEFEPDNMVDISNLDGGK